MADEQQQFQNRRDANEATVQGAQARILSLLDAGDEAPEIGAPSPRPPEPDEGEDEIDAAEVAQGDEAGEDAAPDDQASGEDETDQDEQGDTPAIEPPVSWGADDRALFQKLPPDVQRTIARREADRDKVVQERTAEAARQREAAAARIKEVDEEKQLFLAQAEWFVSEEVRRFQTEFGDVKDVRELARNDPARYLEYKAGLDAITDSQNKFREAVGRYRADQEKRTKEFLAEQEKRLVEAFPEWVDTAKGRKAIGDLREYAVSQGIPAEMAAQVMDAGAFKVLQKAMLYDKMQAAKPRLQKPSANPPPRVVRPGARPDARASSDQRASEAQDRLRKSGRVEDAADAINRRLFNRR